MVAIIDAQRSSLESLCRKHRVRQLEVFGSAADGTFRPESSDLDFLVEYEDGTKAVIEVKDPSRMDSNDVQRKRKAAEMWCKQRRMEYVLATIG